MNFNDTFFEVVTAQHLYMAAILFGISTVCIVTAIYTFLYIKKKRFLYRSKLNEELEIWIGVYIAEDDGTTTDIPPIISKNLNKNDFRDFIIDKLINIKKNIDGSGAAIINELYEKLGLVNDSLQKMKSLIWYKRAKGIYELYMMDQHSVFPEIVKYTNSSNIYVRREAQTAVIDFSGFDGLAFLDTLTYPLYEWQQVKLLEQLKTVNLIEMPNIRSWIESSNNYVAIFALKLAEIYQQFHTHDVVVKSLQHSNDKVRFHAIRTLGNIYEENVTAEILSNQYKLENTKNKKEILEQLTNIGTEKDIPFLLDKLKEEDDLLKLQAARGIAKTAPEGMNMLLDISKNNEVIASITKQIQYEQAA